MNRNEKEPEAPVATGPRVSQVRRTEAPPREGGSSNSAHVATVQKVSKVDLKKKLHISDLIAEKLITTIAFASLAAIVMIFIFVFREAAPIFFGSEPTTVSSTESVAEDETYGDEFLSENAKHREEKSKQSTSVETGGGEGEASAANLISTHWQPVSLEPKYGILPLAAGSLKITLLAIIIAAPIAIFAALYTSSFAPKWSKEVLKPAIEILAGFPSVVIGFFALVFLASMMQGLFGYDYRLNAFVGGVAMSIAVIPIIFTVAEDALTVVPKFMTEASLALGASKWQTALFVTLPAATPGVFAAVLLGFGRALGETMIVLMATGNAALLSWNFLEPVRTMSATIGAEMAEVVFGDTHYRVLFLLGSLLFIFTFILNGIAEVFVRQRLLRRFRGS